MSSYYEILFSPPPLAAPLDLTLTAGAGRLDIAVTHSTEVTIRFTLIEVTNTEDDWTAPIVAIVPLQEAHTALVGLPAGDYWARAKGIDVWSNESDYTSTETDTVTGSGSGGGGDLVSTYDPTSDLQVLVFTDDGDVVVA